MWKKLFVLSTICWGFQTTYAFSLEEEVFREEFTYKALEVLNQSPTVNDALHQLGLSPCISFCQKRQQYFVDALLTWVHNTKAQNQALTLGLLKELQKRDWAEAERIRILKALQEAGDGSVVPEVMGLLRRQDLTPRAEALLANWFAPLQEMKLPSARQVRDLWHQYINVDEYKNGRYADQPRLYMFCRQDRSYPCQMIMKDRFGNVMRYKNGDIWAQPSLGYSRKRKAYNEFDGNTPAGVWRIDGVMPDTNRRFVFGDFRRLILSFVENSESENQTKLLLPPSHHDAQWWQEASVARDIGRGLFRIHGTGMKNFNKNSNYHPFVATRGCIAQRENRYDGVTYKDQRTLLDALMIASGMEAKYVNESRIRALLYVINIDDQKKPVTLDDLYDLGIRW